MNADMENIEAQHWICMEWRCVVFIWWNKFMNADMNLRRGSTEGSCKVTLRMQKSRVMIFVRFTGQRARIRDTGTRREVGGTADR